MLDFNRPKRTPADIKRLEQVAMWSNSSSK